MSDQSEFGDLSAFFEYQLPIFDEMLANENIPLRHRPLHATIKFVTYCIVEIDGDTKDEAFLKPWFKSFYLDISNWYDEKYGEAMKSDINDFALGVVLIYGMPFRIEIPLSVAGERVSKTSQWFHMPNGILEQENVFGWIKNPPNFKKMRAEDFSSVEADLRTISVAIRSLRINLMTAAVEPNALRNLASGIPSHVEKSATDILSMSLAQLSNSVWELHLAIEKSLKLLIRQKGSSAPNTHDLTNLCNRANQMEGVSFDCSLLDGLPNYHHAIQHRYGEAPGLTLERAVENYKAALSAISHITAALSRKIVMNNAGFLIRAAPWLM